MSNKNIKPLKWSHLNVADTPFRTYTVQADGNGKIAVDYESKHGQPATGFETIADAKRWAFKHYAGEMQPYVKPSPTWIDYKIKQPTEKGDYLIRDYQGRVALGKYGNGFYMESGGEKWGMVSHWMPIPEFKQGE